jgi:hypothetical protein
MRQAYVIGTRIEAPFSIALSSCRRSRGVAKSVVVSTVRGLQMNNTKDEVKVSGQEQYQTGAMVVGNMIIGMCF